MQTSLQGISKKAERVKKHRFQDLFRLLNNEMLTEAWRYINKKSATGVDKETAKEFGENLEENIRTIVEKLKRKQYKAKYSRILLPQTVYITTVLRSKGFKLLQFQMEIP